MARSASLPGRPAYLSVLPDFLFREDERAWRYAVKASLLSVGGTFILSLPATHFMATEAWPEAPATDGWEIILVILVAPLFETLLMVPLLFVANRLFGAGPAAVASAALWGVLHGIPGLNAGLIMWWPFLLLSIAYLTWRPAGFARAFLVVAGIHALHNGIFAAALLLTG